jgi:branched-chain amino acid transport system substrate-binding protein
VGVSLRAHSRAFGACALVAGAVLVGGCTAAGTNSRALTGKTLTIYVSAPVSLASDSEAQDVVDAERLAFKQQQGQVSAYRLGLSLVSHNKISDNARQAIGDTGHAIAYLGEVPPGDSADSIGITNAVNLLQVSPTDTAAELTQKTPAVANSPQKYYESLSANGRTFARVVPTTAVEAKALVSEMQSLGVKSLYVTGDNSAYGRTVVQEVRTAASPAITVASSMASADAMFFGGSSIPQATKAFQQAAAGNAKQKLFAPSALADNAFVSGLPPAASRNLYITAPGLLPKQLAASASSFVSSFKAAYGHVPSSQAIFGYEAMSAVLGVLRQAGSSANNRQTVVKDFLGITNRSSPLGTYSIDKNGDTSLSASSFVIAHVKGSKLVPFKQAG